MLPTFARNSRRHARICWQRRRICETARAGGPPDELAQLNGDLAKARANVANLEQTQKALEQLAAKQAATLYEVAQNQAALAQARATLETLQQKKAALAQRTTGDAERAELRAKQAQEQIAVVPGESALGHGRGAFRRHALRASSSHRRLRESGRHARRNGRFAPRTRPRFCGRTRPRLHSNRIKLCKLRGTRSPARRGPAVPSRFPNR